MPQHYAKYESSSTISRNTSTASSGKFQAYQGEFDTEWHRAELSATHIAKDLNQKCQYMPPYIHEMFSSNTTFDAIFEKNMHIWFPGS